MNDAIAVAMGHLRQAAHQLLTTDDPTGNALSLASEVLDLEDALNELNIAPAYVSAAGSAHRSLQAAADDLSRAADLVPPDLRPKLLQLLARMDDDGQR